MSGGSTASSIDFRCFPALSSNNYRKTSDPDVSYNCIGWAAGKIEYWWPDDQGVWPISTREEKVDCFVKAFETLRYELLLDNNCDLEPGYEKVAIFAKAGEPTHAARQLPNGKWTSKMGIRGEDIEHEWGALDGPCYGAVICILRRPTSQVE